MLNITDVEMRSLLTMLGGCDIDVDRSVVFECGSGGTEYFEFVNELVDSEPRGRHVVMHRMRCWRVKDNLKLSVPLEQEQEVVEMIHSCKLCNGQLSDQVLAKVCADWELMGVKVASDAQLAEPSIFIAHKHSPLVRERSKPKPLDSSSHSMLFED